jgi:hypothetical protein
MNFFKAVIHSRIDTDQKTTDIINQAIDLTLAEIKKLSHKVGVLTVLANGKCNIDIDMEQHEDFSIDQKYELYSLPTIQPVASELCKYGNETKTCQLSPMNCQCVHDATFAQDSEPVAEPFAYYSEYHQNYSGGSGIALASEINSWASDPTVIKNKHNEENTKKWLASVPLYTSPPNTQAKLNKAREALNDLINLCEGANERCLDQIGMGLITVSKAKVTLKETE